MSSYVFAMKIRVNYIFLKQQESQEKKVAVNGELNGLCPFVSGDIVIPLTILGAPPLLRLVFHFRARIFVALAPRVITYLDLTLK